MLACDDIMPTGWTPAAASSTLEEWTRTFSRGQQCSCFRITVFYGVRAGQQKGFASGVRKYGKFDDGRWQTRRAAGIIIIIINSSSFILFSKMEKYCWIKQENAEQGKPGSYERLRKPLHAYSLSNLIQWKRRNTHKKH